MFDIGFWEVVLIGIVALLVVGPDKLPSLARTTGLWVGKIRRMVADVRSEVERELHAEELRQALQKPEELDDIKQAVEDTSKTLTEAGRDFEKSVREQAVEEPAARDEEAQDSDAARSLAAPSAGTGAAREVAGGAAAPAVAAESAPQGEEAAVPESLSGEDRAGAPAEEPREAAAGVAGASQEQAAHRAGDDGDRPGPAPEPEPADTGRSAPATQADAVPAAGAPVSDDEQRRGS